MLTLGIALLMIGAVMRISLYLKARQVSRTLAPQWVRLRSIELEMHRQKNQRGVVDSVILMTAGMVIILLTAVFN